MTVFQTHCKTPDEWRDVFAASRPSGGFKTLLFYPPWPWMARSEKGMGKSPEAHYNTMSIDDIAAIPVSALAAKDCALFVWCTWPLMPEWHHVIKAWGFEYAGLAWEWLKFNPETGKYAFGPGYGTRKNVEPCLMATLGNPSLRKPTEFFGDIADPEGVRSVRDFMEHCPLGHIRAPRQQHSAKPDEQYNRIETLFDGPYCEVFARRPRKGWTVIGDQIGGSSDV